MIPLKFGLFWSGANLSYLRYLTFLSLRKHHPNAEIELYWNRSGNTKAKWGSEFQEFQEKPQGKDYRPMLEDIGVKVINSSLFHSYAPNYQSDLFRWWWLYNNGGFYLDTDQIILRSFRDLPLDMDFIYSIYRTKSCGIYAPVGVIGAKKECPILKQVMDEMVSSYDPKIYNSLGPFMFKSLWDKHGEKWTKTHSTFNAPPDVFYPVPESRQIGKIYESVVHLAPESFALHWFGGHRDSQAFNKKFTLKYANEGHDDTISVLSRSLTQKLLEMRDG